MTNDVATALSRIDSALARIERAAAAAPPVAANTGDGRYERLRERTQAALAELDTVIARVAQEARA
ncbi:hypothetical protein [Sphingomonas sp. SUN039]|uniref:hypothetical protein n=1 Tax=Sphingomonas sp. SUN039 TaxID=2937787 RepID=UPI0021648B43|nr:hypothetical protein [Sphingomonas sp. SUN039]UVO53144.1 hypothetical protein M0209_03025 [Sphingomonas sp. SUN039]